MKKILPLIYISLIFSCAESNNGYLNGDCEGNCLNGNGTFSFENGDVIIDGDEDFDSDGLSEG